MNNDTHETNVKMWLSDPLSPEVAVSLQRLAESDDVLHVAVMPDVHLAGEVCNGTAVATKELVYPLAVGADIGCGMLAVAFELDSNALSSEHTAGQVLAGLYQRIPSLKHSRSSCLTDLPNSLAEAPLSSAALNKLKSRDGLFQLGTLGRGNHFVEIQSDVDGRLWLMLHSGSRAIGRMITEHHLLQTQVSKSGLGFLDATTSAGQAYLSDANWAIEYARQNRLAMARAVESIIHTVFETDIDWSTLIHCHHNHVLHEVHSGQAYWVHRKGALPAANHETGVIPGSMGSCSYHVSGRGLAAALQSSSHGAGRLLARNVARHQVSRRDFLRQMNGIWFDQRCTDELREEAPAAYKDISRVMRAQRDLTRIERQLRPVLVYKGT